MKIGFFGTPELSARVLQDCIQAGFEVAYVISQPDRPVGRSAKLVPSPVSSIALSHSIPLFRPERVRGNIEFFNQIVNTVVDYLVVVAYGKILPDEILALPTILPINIHGSLLPKYRWASPIQSALLAGDTVTGVTIMQMTAGMDEWAILSSQNIAIDPQETSESLFKKFEQVSWALLIETLLSHKEGVITPQDQDHSLASYTSKFTKADGQISPLQDSALTIYRKYQAFTPWPGLWFRLNDRRYTLSELSIVEVSDIPAGYARRWVQWALVLGCQSGALSIAKITPEWQRERCGADIFLATTEVDIKQVFI
jgi:methionyl-tRNA formyltransferase